MEMECCGNGKQYINNSNANESLFNAFRNDC